ncbi:MAG: hypothetical protein GY699_03700 [Desulfobacteraceae bacterium]|nr:hypothetical protein [Desulfobacteraceae bacterium]
METMKSKLLSKLLIIKEILLIVALIVGGMWGLGAFPFVGLANLIIFHKKSFNRLPVNGVGHFA